MKLLSIHNNIKYYIEMHKNAYKLMNVSWYFLTCNIVLNVELY